MRPQPLTARTLGALVLGPATVPQLRAMLACSDHAARNALDELAARRKVTIAGEQRGRTGAPARLWRRVA